MGGLLPALLLHLVRDLLGDGSVALDDPGGDLLIPRPGGVLDQGPAVLPAHPVSQAHRVVIVQVGDLRLGPLGPDILQPLPGAPLGHVHHRPVAQLPGGPGHSPAVVAVGGGDEGPLPQLLPGLRRLQRLKGELVLGQPQLFPQMPGHGIAAPQGLEGVQAEALGLVLHQHLGHPQPTGQVVQSGERSGLIARDGAVESLGRLLHLQTGEGQLLRGNGPRPVHTVLKLHGMPPFSLVRPCLKNVNVPKRRAFSRHTALISLAIHKVLPRQIALSGEKIPRRWTHFQFSNKA